MNRALDKHPQAIFSSIHLIRLILESQSHTFLSLLSSCSFEKTKGENVYDKFLFEDLYEDRPSWILPERDATAMEAS